MVALEALKACLITEVAELLKRNGELLEAEKKGKAKVDTLKGEVG